MKPRFIVFPLLAAAVLALPCPSRASVLLSYDDGTYEGFTNSSLAAMVRFTVPTTSAEWQLETLMIYTGRLATNDSIGLKVWQDDAGALGSVLYQRSETVGWGSPYGAWNQFDMTEPGLVFSAGDSFFAGFWQSQPLFAFGDTTAPQDGRSWGVVGSLPNYLQAVNADWLIRVAMVPEPASVPEPCTLAIWSLLGAVGMTTGWLRRRKNN